MAPAPRPRASNPRSIGWASLALALALLSACTADAPTATASLPPASVATSVPSPSLTAPSPGRVEPAPGSDSTVYGPNPGAIVVAIDPGHGGCLDWGVPDPSERGEAYAEKAMTLGIAIQLRELLEAEGVTVVLTRSDDSALAGDDYPDLGCNGPAWRDVDGDGQAGFEETGRVRTRDELQARIDLANLVAADAFISIHINSLTQDGVVFELAATQTFYDDETAWGAAASARLADAIQAEVVAALVPLADYERQNRGTDAVAYYAISREWQDGDTCEVAGDTWCKPHRALQMPGALSEVGSITLEAEQDLLVSPAGQRAVAAGILDGLAAYFGERELSARIALAESAPGTRPATIAGEAAPFWPTVAPDGPVEVRLTNTGTTDWPADVALVGGWGKTELPYLAAAPDGLEPLDVRVPSLPPGASVVVALSLPPAPAARAVAWISLLVNGEPVANEGSPALQLSSAAP